MALYEFFCDTCQAKFEQITSSTDSDYGKCPKCQGKKTHKLISAFRVGGQGDLRENTMHGCHDCHVPSAAESGSSSSSSSSSGSSDGGHACGGGCSH